ncbi:MAG: molybdopterin molybdotransferase MoeA [Alphaproteobacteria bacterium]|nr:molybdopterin molybdotransferase MoeA [Alphaproteobacteria bacterium]MBV8338219.1 molybdopterin molybdotransferase MoeA [Alphaproteobacteria bacterium]
MAQLSDDCFAFGGGLLTVAEALAEIDARLAPVIATEMVPLKTASGRVLARDIIAAMDLPPQANSAVDGYAIAHADLLPDEETVLRVGGRAAAGHPLDRPADRGEAIRIFTGAPMPDGTDTVMMQEDCAIEDGLVRLKPGIRKGANRRRAGEDIAEGEVALPAGKRLRAPDLGLAAALGVSELNVFHPLRVALLSTGDEIFDPGTALPAGAVYDANRFMLSALLTGLGCVVTDFGIRPDRESALVDALATASADHDLIVTSGGVSAGEEDHVKSAVEQLGALHFWRLAIKPGRPVALGQVNGVPLIGLPGNPVAVIVTFIVLARPLIAKLAGAAAPATRLFPVRAGFPYRKKPGRREYVRASLERDGDMLVATKYPKDGAGILSSVIRSDGLVILDESTSSLAAGSIADFLPFSEVID